MQTLSLPLRFGFHLTLILAFLVLPAPAPSQAPQPLSSAQDSVIVGEHTFFRSQLKNGLRALAVHDSEANGLASIFLVVSAGNRDETFDTTGLAHLTEHALYTGTPTTGTDQHDHIVQKELEGESNATTRDEYTIYYDHLIPAESLPRILAMEADRMANLVFVEAAVMHERDRLRTEEAHAYQPSTGRQEKLESVVYRKEGYRFGLRDEKGHTKAPGLGMDLIRGFYAKFYQPQYMAVVVVTPNDPKDALKMIEQAFQNSKNAPATSERAQAPNRPQESEPLAARTKRFASELSRDRVEFCWVLPPRSHPDAASFALWSRILNRRETSAGEPFVASYDEHQGSSMFRIAATGETAYQELEQLLDNLQEQGPGQKEIAAAVREERDRFLNLPLRARPYFSLAADVARFAVYDELDLVGEYHHKIDAAGKSDLVAVAKQWLNPSRRVVVHFAADKNTVAQTDFPTDTKELASLAMEADESGDYPRAVAAYTELLKRKPNKMNTVIYLYQRAAMHMSHKKFDLAITDCENALAVVDYPAVRDLLEEAKRLQEEADDGGRS
jgi:predicted Zn-dependent peptidase